MASLAGSGGLGDLAKCIEELREQRDDVNRSLMRREEERGRLLRELEAIKRRVEDLGRGISEDASSRDELDTTIRESETALMKIMESSQTLLSVVQREAQAMSSRFSSPSRGWREPDEADAGYDDGAAEEEGDGWAGGAGAASAASGGRQRYQWS